MSGVRPAGLIVMGPEMAWAFEDDRRRQLERMLDLGDPATSFDAVPADALARCEVLITSWGAPRLDSAVLSRMPALRAVFHAAGSVRDLVSPELWDRGIVVSSAADANAVPVAEYTLAAIILAGKRAFSLAREPRTHAPWGGMLAEPMIGNVDRCIGIVGFSRIGRRVVELVQMLGGVEVLVADPHADPAVVARAGATLVSLDEMAARVDVLSIHAPELPSTRHLIGRAELALLRDGATVINTARGALLDHDALLAECRTGRVNAVLDVTDPEPLPHDSELLDLPNVTITPHVAGTLGTERARLADSVLEDVQAWVRGEPVPHGVVREQMDVIA
ncbi:phosphoglycerate dehydrogenase-like enzyme [Microbacterium terrae]|uniref:D-3-phosphoglycerate dehydrogenase n=1 Tax=Microbacterium terrae TaxID=69369 RepID=A0A0M2H8C8_9MICO|nr:hydroxyacid dehydrogenase [Microbacterium terrae]KJL42656.1 D-3-phosphoglycerate dehydrogenase [Microbacterium terrae]MBP1079086.1 phosphoglycerate dehydrogenase-like enzyme [Microbacterium terrae]